MVTIVTGHPSSSSLSSLTPSPHRPGSSPPPAARLTSNPILTQIQLSEGGSSRSGRNGAAPPVLWLLQLQIYCRGLCFHSQHCLCVTPHRYQQSRVSHGRLLIAHVSLFALANPVLISLLNTGLDVMSNKPRVSDRPLRNKHPCTAD